MKILIVAAHPDDEVLGPGGTIAKHSASGDEVHCLILSRGPTARLPNEKMSEEEQEKLKAQADQARSILGITSTQIKSCPDNRFDMIPLLDIIKEIEKIRDEIQPNIIYTHYEYDLNIDHRITFQATLTAFRPGTGPRTVRELYSFEVPSSTELSTRVFNPNVFVDMTETLDKKIEALKCYENEVRPYPHPRSPEAIRALSMYRGTQSGLVLAEAFKLVRWIK